MRTQPSQFAEGITRFGSLPLLSVIFVCLGVTGCFASREPQTATIINGKAFCAFDDTNPQLQLKFSSERPISEHLVIVKTDATTTTDVIETQANGNFRFEPVIEPNVTEQISAEIYSIEGTRRNLLARCALEIGRNSVVAGFQRDLQAPDFAPGWRYLWNPTSEFSPANAADLEPLVFNGDCYFESPENSEFGVGRVCGGGTSPGLGTSQGTAHDRYLVLEYRVSVSGVYSIQDSSVSYSEGSSGPASIEIYANDTLLRDVPIEPNKETTFNTPLGSLEADQTIWVALSPEGAGYNEDLKLDFWIVRFGK